MTEKYSVTLVTKVLLTCALHSNNNGNSVSIYHNAVCRLEGEELIPENTSIPPISVAMLQTTIPNQRSRKPLPRDLLDGNIVLLYRDNKMAMQCLSKTTLSVNNKPRVCSNVSIEWFTEPNSIYNTDNGHEVLRHETLKSTQIEWNLHTALPTFDADCELH